MNLRMGQSKYKNYLLLAAALFVYLSVSSALGFLLPGIELVELGGQTFDPTSPIFVFVGSFFAAQVAARHLLGTLIFLDLCAIGYAIHILQPIAENIPDAPSHLDILSANLLGLSLVLFATIVGVCIGNKARIARAR